MTITRTVCAKHRQICLFGVCPRVIWAPTSHAQHQRGCGNLWSLRCTVRSSAVPCKRNWSNSMPCGRGRKRESAPESFTMSVGLFSPSCLYLLKGLCCRDRLDWTWDKWTRTQGLRCRHLSLFIPPVCVLMCEGKSRDGPAGRKMRYGLTISRAGTQTQKLPVNCSFPHS